MSKITCNVCNCTHNTESGCALSSVKVGGAAAQNSAGTRCESFSEQTDGRCGETCSCGCSDVSCKACGCHYNTDGKCLAKDITVSGFHACSDRETSCETFIKE